MVAIIVTINILISILLLYVAKRIWLLKRSFTNLKNIFNIAEHNTHAVLSAAPNAIYGRQTAIKNLRNTNQAFDSKFQKSSQVLSILLMTSRYWRRRSQKSNF
jgi:hypothetical protein